MSEKGISPRESQIIEILYKKGPSTVAEITEAIPASLSRNAVRTFLTLLEGKRHVTREKRGREFVYFPTIDKKKAAQSALSRVLDVFFNGSLSDALAARFDGNHPDLTEEEFEKLQALLEETREEKR